MNMTMEQETVAPVKKNNAVIKHGEDDIMKFIKDAIGTNCSKNTELVIKAIIPGKNYRINFYTTTVNKDRFIPDIDITKSMFIEIIDENGRLDFIDQTNVNPNKVGRKLLKDY